MKTTIELPDALIHSAESLAAERGCAVDEFIAEAVREKIERQTKAEPSLPAAYRKLIGAFAHTPESRAETKRIQAVIDAEFNVVDPLER